MKRLIICEKQLAAKRIASILSNGSYRTRFVNRVQIHAFQVSSVENFVVGLRGHITTLDYPAPYNDWSKIDPQDLVWIPPIKVTTAMNIINTLEGIAKDMDEVIIATDYDREGELIGTEALEFVTKIRPNISVKRARFSALTKDDVEGAFSSMVEVDYALAKSAECRQHIDLVWGATLTRFISLATNQLGKDFLSVGRVQTPTLAIIVDREREIDNFVPKPFWDLTAVLQKDIEFTATHTDSPFWIRNEAVERFDMAKKASSGKVLEVEKKTVNDRGPIPFNTTIFIAEANRLGISAFRAMRIAEDLYTAGYISYPRTDNCAYPPTLNLYAILQRLAKSDLGSLAKKLLASKYRPRNGRATKDHPPIHPVEAATKKDLRADYWKIYELIVKRFYATLAPDAVVEETRVDIEINDQLFISKGYETLVEGWRKFYPYYKRSDVILPALSAGDVAEVLKVDLAEDKTKPPLRFSQGSLIQVMEKQGLGTKSTRHDIIRKLLDRKYVHGRILRPTHIGIAVTKALEENAATITESNMTAVLEEEMSVIVEGKKGMEEVVKESQTMLDSVMKELKIKGEDIGVAITDALRKHNYIGKCIECEGDLMIRSSRAGKRFVACSNYPKCEITRPLPQSGMLTATEEMCECGSPKIKRRSGGWTETMCIDNKCSITKEKNTLGKCNECGGDLTIKYARSGKRFLGCSNFPKCRSTHSLPQKGFLFPITSTCEICASPLVKVVRSGRAWNHCINKNKHKKTEKPKKSKKRKKPKSTSS